MLVQGWVQNLEICVVDILKDQARGFGLWIPYNIQKLDDVCASTDVLQDLDLTLDLQHTGEISKRSLTGVQSMTPNLLFLHRLQDLDDALLVVDDVDAFKDFTVLASANLPDDLIIILVPVDGDST